jgi:hypothetical protein
MKRWLYDFLFEKVIIHAKYLNPVHFSYGLITQFTVLRGRKRRSASLHCCPNPFSIKRDKNSSNISIGHAGCRALWIADKDARHVDKESAFILQFLESGLLALIKLTIEYSHLFHT